MRTAAWPLALLLAGCSSAPDGPLASPAPAARPGPTLVVPAGTVLRLRLVDRLLSSYQHRGDLVIARLDEDVRVADRVALVQGSELRGQVTEVDEKGKLAHLAFRLEKVLRPAREIPVLLEDVEVVGTGRVPRGFAAREPARARGPLSGGQATPVPTAPGQAIDLPAGLALEVRLKADLKL